MGKEYYESAFAFLDLLAVKEKLKSDDGTFLNTLSNIYSSAIGLCKFPFPKAINHQIFSDNIVFEMPISTSNGISEYVILAEFVSVVQDFLLNNNLLVRGGITIGSSYTDENFVLGEALVNAYTIESKIALYPRIVIDPRIVPLIQEYISDKPALSYICTMDNDGLCFIDYLLCPGRPCKDYITIIENALKYNKAELTKNYGTPNIMCKLLWHENYLQKSYSYYQNQLSKKQF